MKSRRAFLAESGVLLAGLMAPGTAAAWGRRRRRSCCPPPVSSCPRSQFRPISKDGTPCTCACPQSCYGQSGDVFFYSCNCCDGGGTIDCGSTQLLTTNTGCPCDGVTTSCDPMTCENGGCISLLQNSGPVGGGATIAAHAMAAVRADLGFRPSRELQSNGLPRLLPWGRGWTNGVGQGAGTVIGPVSYSFAPDPAKPATKVTKYVQLLYNTMNNRTINVGQEVDTSQVQLPPGIPTALFLGRASFHHFLVYDDGVRGPQVFHVMVK